MTDPEDGHPLCCSVYVTNPPECSCWHEEIRMAPRRRPTSKTEAVELSYDQDMNEAS